MSYCNLPQKIETYALNNNISINKLERKANLKPGAIRNILNGRSKRPTIETISQIAKALECSIDNLLNSDSIKEKDSSKNIKIENYQLFESIINFVNKLLKQDNESIQYDKFCNIVAETYRYSIEYNKETLSYKFAKWLYKKEKCGTT